MRKTVKDFFNNKQKYTLIKTFDDVSHHNGLTRISAWGFSILELIRDENINTEEDLYDKIKHLFPKHTVILLNETQRYLNIIKSDIKVTLQDCVYYYYNLFIIRTMKGRLMELEFKTILERRLDDVRFTTAQEDGQYSVDIIIKGKYGVQVKPISYLYMDRQDIKELNNKKYNNFRREYGLPVVEVYYDKNDKWIVRDEEFKKFYYSFAVSK